jgi:hypothetical protein
MNWQRYSDRTRTALAALSQGSCYFPGCRTPILVFLGDRPAVNVDIARIRPAGPDSFDNFLLLCLPHRKAVERDAKSHPSDLLETWKAQREGGNRAALSALDADQLDQLLATAFAAVQGQVTAALARFEETDPESARLVRQLMNDLRDQRRHVDNPDVAALLGAIRDVSARLAGVGTKPPPARKRSNIGWVAGGVGH